MGLTTFAETIAIILDRAKYSSGTQILQLDRFHRILRQRLASDCQ